MTWEQSADHAIQFLSVIPPFGDFNLTMVINTYLDVGNFADLTVYPHASTTVSGHVNGTMLAEIHLSNATGGQIAWRYNIDGDEKSGTSDMTLYDSGLVLFVVSSSREDSNDNIGVLLRITNTTGLPLRVYVTQDDSVSPKFTVSANGEVRI